MAPAIKIQTIADLKPCKDYWDVDRLRALSGGKDEATAETIAAADIPPEDRLWALLRDPFLDKPQLIVLAGRYAQRTNDLGRVKFPPVVEAIRLSVLAAQGQIVQAHFPNGIDEQIKSWLTSHPAQHVCALLAANWASIAFAKQAENEGRDGYSAQQKCRERNVKLALEMIGV